MSALDDVVVLDLTTEMWSGIGASLLGDFGARVIRVEDLSRPPVDPDRDGAHPTETFDADAELVHRNKRSLGIDLAHPEGRALFEALVAKADVLIEGEQPIRTLSPCEIGLHAAYVADGKTMEEYARDRGVSVNAARFLMKGVFGKTGVGRQAELAALLREAPLNWQSPIDRFLTAH